MVKALANRLLRNRAAITHSLFIHVYGLIVICHLLLVKMTFSYMLNIILFWHSTCSTVKWFIFVENGNFWHFSSHLSWNPSRFGLLSTALGIFKSPQSNSPSLPLSSHSSTGLKACEGRKRGEHRSAGLGILKTQVEIQAGSSTEAPNACKEREGRAEVSKLLWCRKGGYPPLFLILWCMKFWCSAY